MLASLTDFLMAFSPSQTHPHPGISPSLDFLTIEIVSSYHLFLFLTPPVTVLTPSKVHVPINVNFYVFLTLPSAFLRLSFTFLYVPFDSGYMG
jgi:hypothetical protein